MSESACTGLDITSREGGDLGELILGDEISAVVRPCLVGLPESKAETLAREQIRSDKNVVGA